MNVCFVTQAFVRYEGDPIGSFVFRLAEEMATHGAAVTMVAPHAGALPDTETIGRTRVVRFRYAPPAFERLAYQGSMHNLVRGSVLNKALLMSFLASFVAQTICTIRRQKSDFIHAHWWFPSGLVGAIASVLTGVPLVMTCHGTDVGLLGRNRAVDSVARWVFGRAAAITAVSTYLQQTLASRLQELDSRVSTIPMPVDRVFTEPTTRTASRRNGQFTVLGAGRLSRQKGFHDLITAACMMKERGAGIKVLLIGDGEEEQSLKRLVSHLHIQDRVEFLGSKMAGELATFYRTCAAVALPARDEGLGLTLIEAMFCGAAAVGARSGGISDVIADNETGLLVPPGDPRALADALQRLLTDGSLADRLSRAGQVSARRNYDPDACMARMLAVYQSVLHARR